MKNERASFDHPRFTKLEKFDPHRASFECKHEATFNPPISVEAEAVFQHALLLGSQDIWPDKRDYVKIASLYQKAMDLGHWKAQFNLAGAYLQGAGVAHDAEKAIELTEDLMKKGVPAAWDNMGAYYMGGVGDLSQDATVAYAFWQRAAEMGSLSAQAYIGAKLKGVTDNPPQWWANKAIGVKMLECAYSQGSARAAYELGLEYYIRAGVDKNQRAKELNYFHEAVKLGSEDAATHLSVAFASNPVDEDGPALANDSARAERYRALSDALSRNPDLRFPNLDKILPLPPAELPKWNGDKQTLIDAAKAVVPKPVAPPLPSASAAPQRTGRAHVPEGWSLPERPQLAVRAQFESTRAPETGYWVARLMYPSTERQRAWNAAQQPMRYDAGELFDRSRPGLVPEDGRIQFDYLGQAVEMSTPSLAEDPRVLRGVARHGQATMLELRCPGNMTCPEAGVWAAELGPDHAMAAVFNGWDRQAYVVQGQRFPDPRVRHLDVAPGAVEWRWLGDANATRGAGLVCLTVAGLGDSPEASGSDSGVSDSDSDS